MSMKYVFVVGLGTVVGGHAAFAEAVDSPQKPDMPPVASIANSTTTTDTGPSYSYVAYYDNTLTDEAIEGVAHDPRAIRSTKSST